MVWWMESWVSWWVEVDEKGGEVRVGNSMLLTMQWFFVSGLGFMGASCNRLGGARRIHCSVNKGLC